MKQIVFSKQCDADKDIIPLWYHWYTNIFKPDKIVILAASVKGSTTTDWLRRFYKGKDVVFKEEVYDTWDAPRVWQDQKRMLDKYLPEKPWMAVSADADEFLEPVTPAMCKGKSHLVFKQARLATLEPLTLDNVHDIDIFKVPNNAAAIAPNAVSRGAFINNLNNKKIIITGASDKPEENAPLFYHFHFRGKEWYKNKFGKMKYRDPNNGSSFHWKRYTRIIQENKLEEQMDNLLNILQKAEGKGIDRFRKYFDNNNNHNV